MISARKLKRILVWIPILGMAVPFVFKNKHKAMYKEYFSWGGPWLVIASMLWHAILASFVITILIELL